MGCRLGDDGIRSPAGVPQRTANIVLFDTHTGEPINVIPYKGVRYSAVAISAAPYDHQFDTIVCVWNLGDTSINLLISLRYYIYISLQPAL